MKSPNALSHILLLVTHLLIISIILQSKYTKYSWEFQIFSQLFFIYFSTTHFCTHPATLKDTKNFPYIQIKQVTICQAYTNYIIRNKTQLLLKISYYASGSYRESHNDNLSGPSKPYKNGLRKKIILPHIGARAFNI